MSRFLNLGRYLLCAGIFVSMGVAQAQTCPASCVFVDGVCICPEGESFPDCATDPVAGCPGNIVAAGAFECGATAEPWQVTGPGNVLCTTGSCGVDTGSGPRSGTGWLRFGGLSGAATVNVEQEFILPAINEGFVDVRFFLELTNLRPEDSMTVFFDEVPIFRAEAGTTGFDVYQSVLRRLLRRTDGGVHSIRFEGITGAEAEDVSIAVDDLCITVSDLAPEETCPGGIPAVGTQRVFAQPMKAMNINTSGDATGSSTGTFTVQNQVAPVVNGVFFNVVHDFGAAARVRIFDGPPNVSRSNVFVNFGSYFCGDNTIGVNLTVAEICRLLNGDFWLVFDSNGEEVGGQILPGISNRSCLNIGEGEMMMEGEGEGEGMFTMEGEGEGQISVCEEVCPGLGPDIDGDGLDTNCETCLGTSNTSTDSDADGLPDGYEFENGLNPTNPLDALLDKDNDGIANLIEFINGSDPCDATSPAPVRFVSPSGLDVAGGGSAANPWKTIGFAVQQVSDTGLLPVRLQLAAGAYTEDVTLISGVTLVGPPCDLDDPAFDINTCASIRGTMTGATGAALESVVLEQAVNSATLLVLNNVAMELRQVVFLGNAQREATAIRATGAAIEGTIIENCDFSSLSKGIDVQDSVPVIRRSSFVGHSGTYIQFRSTDLKQANSNGLGSNTNPNSGRNRFAAPGTGELTMGAVVNERSEAIVMEANEWGTEDPAEIDALIAGPADFEPFLVTGAALLAGSLFVTVWDAETQNPVLDAGVSLQISVFNPVTDNENGVYPFVSVEEGQYTVTATADGFPPAMAFADVGAGEIVSVVLPLGAVVQPACGCGSGAGTAAWGTGDAVVILSVIGLLVFFTMLGANRRRVRRVA